MDLILPPTWPAGGRSPLAKTDNRADIARVEYEAGLRRRGSLTLWMTAEALSSWQVPKRTTRGGQPRYSDQAARPLHFNKRIYPRPHRQHRRRNPWRRPVAGGKARRVVAAGMAETASGNDSGEIIAHVMTNQDTGDASQVEPLLDQIDAPIGQFTADGAYDGKPIYDVVTRHSAGAAVVIPPRSNAVDRSDTETANQRDWHITAINTDGRLKW